MTRIDPGMATAALATSLGVAAAEPRIAPFGTWHSPVTAADVAADAPMLAGFLVVDDLDVYALEMRPAERGRGVIVRVGADGAAQAVTPAGFNVRSRVHEYGGAPFTVAQGTIYFSNFADGRLYVQRPHAAPEPITPEGPWRYADCVVDAARQRLICVREDHSAGDDPRGVVNALVAVPIAGGAPVEVLWSGTDFVGAPRLSPDGTRLAFVAWNHPNMPWDATSLQLGTLGADGALARVRAVVADGAGEAVMQPAWSRRGALRFVGDRSGWWNLYELPRGGRAVRPVGAIEGEIGKPPWTAAGSAHVQLPDGTTLAAITRAASDALFVRRPRSRAGWRELVTPYVWIEQLRLRGERVVFLGATRDAEGALVELDPASGGVRELYRPSGRAIDARFVSRALAFDFPGADGAIAHAWLYAPANPGYRAPPEAKPPLLVGVHGGPTSHSSPAFSLERTFWTSRGFAVLEVNFSGSTGFGTAYRRRLDGRWGEIDVADVVAAARAAAAQGLADGDRMVVRGGSAGGFAVLASLAFHPDVFAAGMSFYGVSDLRTLAADTHKFESRYLDRLVGPLPAAQAIYAARSPLGAVDRIRRPLLVLQGLEDKVVPPAQSEAIVAALRRNRVPVAYLTFAGEGHGFRGSEARIGALQAQLAFLSRVLGFAPPEAPPALAIEHLP